MYVNDVKMQKMFITIIFIVLLTGFSFSCKTQDVGNNNIDLELYDVLIVGERIVSAVGSKTQEAVYWKNGELFILARNTSLSGWPDITANSICLSGNDVYIAGQNRGKAVYWKNGEETQLTDKDSIAESIYVIDNDVYVAGYERKPVRYFNDTVLNDEGVWTDTYVNVATYWKTGLVTCGVRISSILLEELFVFLT
jgi:hypothetical protein